MKKDGKIRVGSRRQVEVEEQKEAKHRRNMLEDKKTGAREIKQLVTLHRGSSQQDLIMFSV